jgi:Fe-S-cluster containining protein
VYVRRMDAPDTGGCIGACCAAFYVPYTIRELRTRDDLQDAAFIADMVIPLSPKEARERSQRFGGSRTRSWPWKLRGHYFSCRHWDEESRLCTVYDERPRMCSGYPYQGKPCLFSDGCTYTAAGQSS